MFLGPLQIGQSIPPSHSWQVSLPLVMWALNSLSRIPRWDPLKSYRNVGCSATATHANAHTTAVSVWFEQVTPVSLILTWMCNLYLYSKCTWYTKPKSGFSQITSCCIICKPADPCVSLPLCLSFTELILVETVSRSYWVNFSPLVTVWQLRLKSCLSAGTPFDLGGRGSLTPASSHRSAPNKL